MKLIKREPENDPTHIEYVFMCPGCDENHSYIVKWGPKSLEERAERYRKCNVPVPHAPEWTFNGDFENPSFQPSLLYAEKKPRCHLYLTGGQLQFCKDCEHPLAGKTVPLPHFGRGEGP